MALVRCYIGDQEVHHRKTSFEKEFKALLRAMTSILMRSISGADPVSPASQALPTGVLTPRSVALRAGLRLWRPSGFDSVENETNERTCGFIGRPFRNSNIKKLI